MDSKKRLSWELVIFGLVLVLAGFFVYLQQKNISVTEVWDKVVQRIKPTDIQRAEVLKEKTTAEENYQNFVRSSSLDSLLNDAQYQKLQGTDVNINIGEGVGNPEPFNKPPAGVQP
jgi:hypothetical protein